MILGIVALVKANNRPNEYGGKGLAIGGIVTSGLSKAYGLPGLRIGWIVAPSAFVASTWAYHDYTTIAPGAGASRRITPIPCFDGT